MTPETPEHRSMPLTLAFKPESLHEDEETAESLEGIVLVQPSAKEEGRIFVGVNPFGKAVGCHLLPEEARRVRDHLNVLLLEPDDAPLDSTAEVTAAIMEAREQALAQGDTPWTPEQLLAFKRRRETAKRSIRLPKIPKPQFRLEFKWGSFEALIVRLTKRG